MVTEHWKAVHIGLYAPYYEISSLGRLRAACHRFANKRSLTPTTLAGYIYPPIVNHLGRVWYQLQTGGSVSRPFAHRLVAFAFLHPSPEKPHVNHIDGNPLNNNVDNLEWCTPAENMAHASALGLVARGERHGNAKITTEQVMDLRATYQHGKYGERKRWAERLKCDPTLVWLIVTGRAWKHVPMPPY